MITTEQARNPEFERGFTLIELMIVVVIIGILAAIAIPKFTAVTKSAKEAEANPVLHQILTLEERYQAREGTYAADIGLLEGGLDLAGTGKYFTYSVAAHATGFCAIANLSDAGTAADLTAHSLDANGTFHDSADCS